MLDTHLKRVNSLEEIRSLSLKRIPTALSPRFYSKIATSTQKVHQNLQLSVLEKATKNLV